MGDEEFTDAVNISVRGIDTLSLRTGRPVFHTLFFEQQNTGLTPNATEFSMSKVADRGLRFRLVSLGFKVVLLRGRQGHSPLLKSH
jgi:hypothetical protein